MIYQICDVTMSISASDKVHLWVYLLNQKLLTHQTFWMIWRTGAKFQAPWI